MHLDEQPIPDTRKRPSPFGVLAERADLLAAALFFTTLALFVPKVTGHYRGGFIDLLIYRATAGGVFHGHQLYERLAPGGGTGFTYPPFGALVLSPLVPLSAHAGFVVMTTISLVCAARIAIVLGRRCAATSGARLSTATAIWLLLWLAIVIDPTNSAIELGQVALPVLWLVVEDLLGAVPSRHRGYLVGLAAGFKLIPGLFIVTLLVSGRRDDARRGIVAFLSTVVVGFVVDAPASLFYWRHLGPPSSVGDLIRAQDQSIYGTFARLVGKHEAAAPFVLAAAIVTAATLYAFRRFDRAGQPLAAVATGWTGALLISPVSWSNYYVWLLPVLALLVALSTARARYLLLLLPSIGVLAIRWYMTVPYDHDRERHWHAGQLPAGDSYVILACVLLAWLVVEAVRHPGLARAREAELL